MMGYFGKLRSSVFKFAISSTEGKMVLYGASIARYLATAFVNEVHASFICDSDCGTLLHFNEISPTKVRYMDKFSKGITLTFDMAGASDGIVPGSLITFAQLNQQGAIHFFDLYIKSKLFATVLHIASLTCCEKTMEMEKTSKAFKIIF